MKKEINQIGRYFFFVLCVLLLILVTYLLVLRLTHQ